jgi:hypothetical protein
VRRCFLPTASIATASCTLIWPKNYYTAPVINLCMMPGPTQGIYAAELQSSNHNGQLGTTGPNPTGTAAGTAAGHSTVVTAGITDSSTSPNRGGLFEAERPVTRQGGGAQGCCQSWWAYPSPPPRAQGYWRQRGWRGGRAPGTSQIIQLPPLSWPSFRQELHPH